MIYDKYIIADISDLYLIPEFCKNDIIMSYNGTRFILKWSGVNPSFLFEMGSKQGPFEFTSLVGTLELKEWFGPDGK